MSRRANLKRSGKWTLLTIAGRLEESTSGEVIVAGKSLSKMSRHDRARPRRQKISFLFPDVDPLFGPTAATAGIFGRLGALLGIFTANLAAIAWYRNGAVADNSTSGLAHVPVANPLIILVAMPTAVAVGGWLFAGREQRWMSR